MSNEKDHPAVKNVTKEDRELREKQEADDLARKEDRHALRPGLTTADPAVPGRSSAMHIAYPGGPETPVSSADLRKEEKQAQDNQAHTPELVQPVTASKPWPAPPAQIANPAPGTRSGPAPADKSPNSDWNPAGSPPEPAHTRRASDRK